MFRKFRGAVAGLLIALNACASNPAPQSISMHGDNSRILLGEQIFNTNRDFPSSKLSCENLTFENNYRSSEYFYSRLTELYKPVPANIYIEDGITDSQKFHFAISLIQASLADPIFLTNDRKAYGIRNLTPELNSLFLSEAMREDTTMFEAPENGVSFVLTNSVLFRPDSTRHDDDQMRDSDNLVLGLRNSHRIVLSLSADTSSVKYKLLPVTMLHENGHEEGASHTYAVTPMSDPIPTRGDSVQMRRLTAGYSPASLDQMSFLPMDISCFVNTSLPDSSSAISFLNLGNDRFHQGLYDEAILWFENAARIAPEKIAYEALRSIRTTQFLQDLGN